MSFNRVVPQIATFRAGKRLEERNPVPQDAGAALAKFQELLAAHERRDARNLMWLAGTVRDMLLAQHVETEFLLAHALTMSHTEDAEKHRAALASTEQEWHIFACLHQYFANAMLQADAEVLAAFLRDRRNAAPASAPAKPGKKGGAVSQYVKLRQGVAVRLFAERRPLYFCPCKVLPVDGPFASQMLMGADPWLDRQCAEANRVTRERTGSEHFVNDPAHHLFGVLAHGAFHSARRAFEFMNCSYETGYRTAPRGSLAVLHWGAFTPPNLRREAVALIAGALPRWTVRAPVSLMQPATDYNGLNRAGDGRGRSLVEQQAFRRGDVERVFERLGLPYYVYARDLARTFHPTSYLRACAADDRPGQ